MEFVNLPIESEEFAPGCCDPNGTCHCSNPECEVGCNPNCNPNTACPPVDIMCPFCGINK